ncbi:MAG: bifunctional riboflavin kinase/FAD synthetase [Bacteroidota bacterium]
MRVFYQLEDLPKFKRAVLTIGSFDGVHTGHQQLLARINGLARQHDGESVVITFHPHPRLVIYPKDKSLQLLTSIEEKVALFERYGVDNVVVVPFTVAFSQLSADEYIQRFLLDTFQPQTVVIGYDHRFGLNRQGNIEYLRWYSEKEGFDLIEIEPQEVDNIAVSSTKIRNALLAGEVRNANRWLNHNYQLGGKVVHGQHLGTELGYPTANLVPEDDHKLIPTEGIYAVRVRWQEQWYGAMLYIGRRPSIKGVDDLAIEAHIFDFSEDIYGETLTVEFLQYIRGDQRFDDIEQLKARLYEDEIAARKILSEEVQFREEESMTADSLAIVILNYNGAKYLREYLPSVLESVVGTSHQVIVADNASTDESVSILQSEFPNVEVIVLPENYGFADGYNQALKQVEATYYVLLNSDVKVVPGWLSPCLEQLRANSKLAACQPKIKSLMNPSAFEYAGAAGGWLDALGYPFCRGRIFATVEEDKGQYDEIAPIFWASGAAMFVRADLFHAFGGFDPDYFAHAEEIDLCWRMKRAGYTISAVPQAEVYHLGGGTLEYLSVRKTYLNFRNTLITGFKNEPTTKLLWWLPLRLVLDGLAGFLFLSQGKYRHIWAIVQAHWHFFPKLRYWWKRKKDINLTIEKLAVGPPNTDGVYTGSVVWAYYLRKVHFFRQLLPKQG